MTIQGSSCYLFTILFDSRISRIMKVSILITTEIDGPAHQTISGFARGFYFVLPVLILFVIPAPARGSTRIVAAFLDARRLSSPDGSPRA